MSMSRRSSSSRPSLNTFGTSLLKMPVISFGKKSPRPLPLAGGGPCFIGRCAGLGVYVTGGGGGFLSAEGLECGCGSGSGMRTKRPVFPS